MLYISIHRGAFDYVGREVAEKGGRGNGFFPGTGFAAEVGRGPGIGKNVNVPFESAGHDDSSYVLAFNWIVLPISRQFQPDVIFVCAGFDAASGDTKSKADFQVSPRGFGWMTKQLLQLPPSQTSVASAPAVDDAKGDVERCEKDAEQRAPQMKVIMALEGGYDIDSIAEGGLECIRSLMGEDDSNGNSDPAKEAEAAEGFPELPAPNAEALETMRKVAAIQSTFWVLPTETEVLEMHKW